MVSDDAAAVAKFASDAFVRSAVDVEIPIDESLWAELDPGVVAVHHQNEVVIVSPVQAVQVLGGAFDFGEVRAAFDESRVVEVLVPVDDCGIGVAQDVC